MYPQPHAHFHPIQLDPGKPQTLDPLQILARNIRMGTA